MLPVLCESSRIPRLVVANKVVGLDERLQPCYVPIFSILYIPLGAGSVEVTKKDCPAS